MSQTERTEIGGGVERTGGFYAWASEEERVDDQGNPIEEGSDIDFACPGCGHQFVIDVRGAGLTVACTECGHPVQVPIPGGMEVADLDGEPEQLFAQIVHLRRTLVRAEDRIVELERVVASLMEHRSASEKARLTTLHRCVEMGNLLNAVARIQGEMTSLVQRVQSLLAEEEKQT